MLSQKTHLFLLLLLLLITAATADSSIASPPEEPPETVYDILKKFGLPPGLLPNTVKSYTLSTDGDFTVDLEGPCYVQFEYLVWYDRRITGNLKYGGIHQLKGIEVKRFFLWLNVDEITVDLPPPSDNIYFQVGIITRRLDVKQFLDVHTCKKGSILESLKFPEPVWDDLPMLLTE
ncbi:hypothetical protein QJS04_geneDACA020024 [Acorus gramineus]|uniref:Uncharacterized protein n=1 Tax=Acorus gramineus TaxID=55184 RepID=A0AAV9A4S5_ACOGR|nr:hypothetical protein QJS04_geneDACA020024 [Acorus gramineus]